MDLWMYMSFSVDVCIELTFNMPISCNTNYTIGFLLCVLLAFFPNDCCQSSPSKPIERGECQTTLRRCVYYIYCLYVSVCTSMLCVCLCLMRLCLFQSRGRGA